MLFRYEPIVFDELFSRTAPVEWAFPDLLARFAVANRTNDYPSVNVAEDKDGSAGSRRDSRRPKRRCEIAASRRNTHDQRREEVARKC